MHLVKYKNLKPKIDRANLKNITIEAGKSCKPMEIKVAGEPPPECKWYFLGKDGDKNEELSNNDHVKINNKDYLTEFQIKDALRSQSGKYKLVATNVNGTDEEVVTINVISPPSKPKGPLIVSKGRIFKLVIFLELSKKNFVLLPKFMPRVVNWNGRLLKMVCSRNQIFLI